MEPKFQVGQRIRVIERTPLLSAGQRGRVADIRKAVAASPPFYMFYTPDGKRHWLEESRLEADDQTAADDRGEPEPS